jgi:WD40 repeat protein
VGTAWGSINIHDVQAGYSPVGCCRAPGQGSALSHNTLVASIRSLQWSEDSKALQSENSAYAVTHWDLTEAECDDIPRRDADEANDEVWAKWEALVGWPVQAIHEACKPGAHVCNVDCRADLAGVGGAVRVLRGDKDALSYTVVGDSDGTIRLMRFPALTGTKAYTLQGHGSTAGVVGFTPDGSRVLVAAGPDLAVFQ